MKDFGLKMTGGREQCIEISRKWWAIQIIPIGFSATYNTGKESRVIAISNFIYIR